MARAASANSAVLMHSAFLMLTGTGAFSGEAVCAILAHAGVAWDGGV